jgi:rhomboid family GlyGly-CTERM serine protease
LRPEARRGAWAWAAVGALLVAPALAAWTRPGAAALLGWRPALWLAEPWRWWGAAWVHQSALHLGANLAGAALVVALGLAARLPVRAAAAWALAWPLTHLGLLAMPALAGYGGLSGVLHAGVAVTAVALALRAGRDERRLGMAIAAVLAAKVLSETPWRAPLAHPAGWDVAVAPIAHASGALSGALAAALLLGIQPRRRRSSAVVE